MWTRPIPPNFDDFGKIGCIFKPWVRVAWALHCGSLVSSLVCFALLWFVFSFLSFFYRHIRIVWFDAARVVCPDATCEVLGAACFFSHLGLVQQRLNNSGPTLHRLKQ
jgi:hypothetical protein